MNLPFSRSEIIFTIMSGYEKMEGKRKASTIYIHENFIYSVVRQYEDRIYVRCINYNKSHCKGLGVIHKCSDTFEVKATHNHDTEELEITVRKFRNEVKDAVAKCNDNMQKNYRDISAKYPTRVVQLCSFSKLRTCLHRIRKATNIETVETAENVGNVANEVTHNRCPVCLGEAEETWAFVPCGHSPFCSSCCNIVLSTTNHCPICRQGVTSSLRIYSN